MTWQFWLDVGGTFTDCIARRPDGKLLRRKVLSSATVKGKVEAGTTRSVVIDSYLERIAENFWRGYRLRLLDHRGQVVGESAVTLSNGALSFETPLPRDPQFGQSYELQSPEEAPLFAIRLFLGLPLNKPIPPCAVRLGTTRGTNALLTRKGAKTALVTTRGLADILHIGYQNRPKLFELAIRKPPPLFTAVAEIDERIGVDGRVLKAADVEQIRSALLRLKTDGIEALAICLLNSYANDQHERQVERVARQLGFEEISVSHHVSPLMRIVPRGDTTVVDAYLNPVLRTYVERLSVALPGSDVRLMTSAGGLTGSAHFTGKDSVLSGPAGGVVGTSRAAGAAGYERAIGFDMGGTSTDVSRYEGRYEYEYETQKAGARIVVPMLAIETVAAGGGSICKFDGVKLIVGPDSAGADPGPACYGRGGPLTVTDCNLLLGRVLAEHFPFPLERDAAESRLAEVVAQVGAHQDSSTAASPPSELGVAEGFIRIANANMAQAIRSISIAKGYDPRDYLLVAFGAAGPQHACAVARELGISRILIHSDAGVLSALGIGLADVVKHRTAGIYRLLSATDMKSLLHSKYAELEEQVRADLRADRIVHDRIEINRSLDLRYQGTDAALTIGEPQDAEFLAAFISEHRRLYGYVHQGRDLEVVAVRVEAVSRAETTLPNSAATARVSVSPGGLRQLFFDGRWHDAHLYDREKLLPGSVIQGPGIVVEPLTTTIVDPGWQASVLTGGELLLNQIETSSPNPRYAFHAPHLPADPILLELFNNHFTAIATQMGITLRNTSVSVNVKERLDFSCAIFTAEGDLVVNAPHIPVHLGAMSQTVKQILADNPDLAAGDVFVTNDPYRGGSHLPDITVVTPVFGPESSEVLFFTASRAHHAEIGGITPGSMPPFSTNLAEEGVLIRNFKLQDRGVARFEELRELLGSGHFPSRGVDTNLADITAQMVANHQGAEDLRRMVAQFSLPVVQAYMRHIQEAAERKIRAALARLPNGRREFVDHLDDGAAIRVAITIAGDRATIDFTGTGPVHKGNLNANPAIVTAAVIYVLRLLIGEDIPLNQGVLAPIELVIPQGLLNPPQHERPEECAAVVGGNVETSQRMVDVLLGALGLAAASQGTMNNVLFGNPTFGYYETICGGSGATESADGADAVHTHMTNTRLTDPEVLEARYPVRLLEFSIRRGSGGCGAHCGGDGVVRRIEFLKPLTLSILSQRRGAYPPFGLAGGEPGALGKNTIVRADGRAEVFAGLVQTDVAPGDVLIVETPGGGGWGKT
jgi:5-oxoprolinase (ATP-hydrolysing)